MNWSINHQSIIKKPNLTDVQINNAIYSIIHPYQVNWNKEYTNDHISEWTVQKNTEIRDLFTKNLIVSIDNNTVSVSSSYSVEFPDDWDKRDVSEWCEGFIQLSQSYVFVEMEKIVAGEIRDKEIYDSSRDFLTDLMKKQVSNIHKLI